MNVFFLASIHGKKQYQANYQKIIDLVTAAGHKVVADHVMDRTPNVIQETTQEQSDKFYKKIIAGIKKADTVFADVSYTSTSIGYLLSVAVSLGKPVIVFFSGEEEPHIFRAVDAISEKLTVVRYKKIGDLDSEVPLMIEFVNDVQDTRFNFFVSPNISSYLNWVSKHRRVPRSVYLRKLIDQDMMKNDEYS
jgi:nucleoside 2-deoxyribosyltransferase